MFPQRVVTFSSSFLFKFRQPGIFSSLLTHSRAYSLSSTNSRLFQLNSRSSGFAFELRRGKRSAAVNFGVLMVPQQEAWILERFGKFHKTLEPVLRVLKFLSVLYSILNLFIQFSDHLILHRVLTLQSLLSIVWHTFKF